MPAKLLELRDVIPHYLVRRDNNIVILEPGHELASFTSGTRIQYGFQVVYVLEHLVVPMASERRRANDERRQMNSVGRFGFLISLHPFVVFARENTDRLKRFAKTHVCKDR
jgi:hypothetical protein